MPCFYELVVESGGTMVEVVTWWEKRENREWWMVNTAESQKRKAESERQIQNTKATSCKLQATGCMPI